MVREGRARRKWSSEWFLYILLPIQVILPNRPISSTLFSSYFSALKPLTRTMYNLNINDCFSRLCSLSSCHTSHHSFSPPFIWHLNFRLPSTLFPILNKLMIRWPIRGFHWDFELKYKGSRKLLGCTYFIERRHWSENQVTMWGETKTTDDETHKKAKLQLLTFLDILQFLSF